MPRFHFDIHENGRFIPDETGQDFVDAEGARKEAVLTGASIARDAFIAGSAHRVVVAVRENGAPRMNISITLAVEDA
ncbi:DUF6894 family protein [Bradyrhizobium sp. 930_D9_N1_4]|uniref:DUF6894 family protein n=1 Tax=Bradyrhizobium sp. 930_D9_N1_4 TaxID=3240374 RepID=UPI003F8C3FAA